MKVLFFSEYGRIMQHSIIEQSFTRKSTDDVHAVTFMTCERTSDAPCLNMQAHGITKLEILSFQHPKDKVGISQFDSGLIGKELHSNVLK